MNDRPLQFECVDDDMAAVLRQKSERERLEIAFGMWRFARRMVEQVVRQEHPDWSEQLVQRQVAHRMSHGTV